MADKTLYDILELSPSASSDAIRAAYERLSATHQEQADRGVADARIQLEAVKQAFFTLANAEKRAQYDQQRELRSARALNSVEVVEPFWTWPKLIVIAILVLGSGAYYYKQQQDLARAAAEKTALEAKAKAEAEKAKAEAETERLALERERETRNVEIRQRNEREMALRQYGYESRVTGRTYNPQVTADSREMQRRRDEAQAASAARQQYARDRAELCRMERERYGYSSSC